MFYRVMARYTQIMGCENVLRWTGERRKGEGGSENFREGTVGSIPRL